MLNLIEKLHAIMVSDKIYIWHFPNKKEGQKFRFWLTDEPENELGHSYYTLETMIDAAYKHIDPLEQPIPEQISTPDMFAHLFDETGESGA